MSSRNEILGILWSGQAKVIAETEAALFRTLLAALFPGRAVLIGIDGDEVNERALLDDTEVMPALSLGDVVAEELGISVPYGAVIAFVPLAVFSPQATSAVRGVVVGRVYAQILIESLHRGGFPMDREMGLLLGLADSAVAAVAQLQAGCDQICRDSFERALSETLCSALSGDNGSAGRAANIKDLHDRYGVVSRAEYGRAPREGGPLSFEEWLLSVAPAMGSQTRGEELAAGERQLRSSKI
ncbi:hypothetical protein N8I71_16005 [Roseibacterium sp. SDUM158016]|jgi:hypothetical protein|uniref:hypothetical protein n=1 Tax=Roseicyclus sediminis TaxID=2980997 RepID=UPI0021D24EFB|nr:hypothetical protein [Roseibacterium sp. SDUM158016]MCU4654345.1 hypothetical protein [Roseibacterium sp. SDUM158016]